MKEPSVITAAFAFLTALVGWLAKRQHANARKLTRHEIEQNQLRTIAGLQSHVAQLNASEARQARAAAQEAVRRDEECQRELGHLRERLAALESRKGHA